MSSHVALTFRCSSDFYRRSIQGFSKIAAPLTSMLRTSSSTDSSTSATQIAVKCDGVDGGGGKSVEKSSKSRRIVKKSEEQRPEKSAKAIGLEEPSFLTSDIRLAFTKMGSSHTKLTMENYWPLWIKNQKLQARSSRANGSEIRRA